MPLPIYQSGEKSQTGPKNVIAVAAGKGGVGKSTVTVNLALALQQIGYTVGIMDTDIYGPSIRRMLPEEQLPTQKGPTIMPAICHGIKVISLAYFRSANEAAVVRAPIANSIVTQFIQQVQWGPLDFLLIDFPPGTGDIQLTLSQRANLAGAVMVTTPQEVAVMDVRKAMHMFEQVHVPIIGVVENMSYYTHKKTGEHLALFGEGGGERLANEERVAFLGKIPLDPAVSKNGDDGLSLFDQSTDEGGARLAFRNLASEVVKQIESLRQGTAGCLSHFELDWKEMETV